MTLSEGDNLALAPDLDYLDLYLLGPTGDDGTGSATAELQRRQRRRELVHLHQRDPVRDGAGAGMPGYADDFATAAR